MPFGPRRRGGLVRTVGRTAVIAGTASAVGGRVQKRQSDKWADQNQQAAEAQAYEQQMAAQQMAAQQQAAAPPPPPPPASGGDDMIEQLERLGKLKEEGILTDEEFAAQKAKILGG